MTASLDPNPPAAAVPEWVHLLPRGTFRDSQGAGPYTLASPAAVITASMVGGKLPIDENGATDGAGRLGFPCPAMGWIVELRPGPDGIWGRVRWTPSGRKLLAEGAYCGIRPFFTHAKDGAIIRILRAALTNAPLLPQLTSLNSQGGAPMPVAMPVPDARKAAAETFVCNAIVSGKMVGVLSDYLISLHMRDPQKAQRFVASMPSVDAPGSSVHAQKGASTPYELTETDRRVCHSMGIDPKKFAEYRAERLAGPQTHGLSKEELAVCHGMSIDPKRFAEHKQERLAGPQTHGLSKEELAVCRNMGIDPKQFAEHKQERLAPRQTHGL